MEIRCDIRRDRTDRIVSLDFPAGRSWALNPVTGATLEVMVSPGEGFGIRFSGPLTESDGAFSIAVPAGTEYSVSAQGASIDFIEWVTSSVSVKAGATADLGDVKIKTEN